MTWLVLLQDITVGNPAKAQLARAVRNPEEAFNIMKGNFFVVETKFDGELAYSPANAFFHLCGNDRVMKVFHCCCQHTFRFQQLPVD